MEFLYIFKYFLKRVIIKYDILILYICINYDFIDMLIKLGDNFKNCKKKKREKKEVMYEIICNYKLSVCFLE